YLRKKRSQRRGASPLLSSEPPVLPQTIPQLASYVKQFSGKILLRDEIHVSEPIFQQLLNANYFLPLPAMSQTLFSTICARCNNRKHSLFGQVPCIECGHKHLYCRNCIAMGRVMQ